MKTQAGCRNIYVRRAITSARLNKGPHKNRTKINASLLLLKSVLLSLFWHLRSQMEEECCPSTEPQTDERKPEPLTVIEQDEVANPQPAAATANQAMKGTCDNPRIGGSTGAS